MSGVRDMTQKDTFTKRINYEYNELDTIAEYLEEAAADGWELTSKTGAIWGFRRSNPRKVRFSVEVVDTDVTGDALDEFLILHKIIPPRNVIIDMPETADRAKKGHK